MRNTMTDTAFLAGQEHALRHLPYFRIAPLSGEYAGESMPEIAHAYGLPTDSDDWADDFEAGYFTIVATYEAEGEGR